MRNFANLTNPNETIRVALTTDNPLVRFGSLVEYQQSVQPAASVNLVVENVQVQCDWE